MDGINQQHQALQEAFDYFNKVLFEGELPNCFLNFSRKKNAMGFFAPHRWEERDIEAQQKPRHEISLCPDWVNKDTENVYSTLVHEMVHLWQQEFGKPSRRGYHNKQFAKKMIQIGLFPSSTGRKGGKIIGQNMSHYVIKEGVFQKAFDNLPDSMLLPFSYRYALYSDGNDEMSIGFGAKDPKNKVKYRCPVCNINVWGKPYLKIECGECHTKFQSVQ